MSKVTQKKRGFLKPIETLMLALLATTAPTIVSAEPNAQFSNTDAIHAVISKSINSSTGGEPLLIKQSDAVFSKASHYSHYSHRSHSSHHSHSSHYSSSY